MRHDPADDEAQIMREFGEVLKGCAIELVALAVVVAVWKLFV